MNPEIVTLLTTIDQYRTAKQWFLVAQCYLNILTLDQNHQEALFELGKILHSSGDQHKALRLFQRRLNLTPDDADVTYMMGQCHLHLEDQEKGIALFKQVLQHTPNHMKSLKDLARIFSEQHQLGLALHYCKQIKLLYPNHRSVYMDLTRIYFLLGDLKNAEYTLTTAQSVFPDAVQFRVIHLFIAAHNDAYTPQTLFELHKELLPQKTPNAIAYSPKSKIRICIISDTFDIHPTGRCLLPLFQHIDKNRFELFALSFSDKTDYMNQLFTQYSTRFINCSNVLDSQITHIIKTLSPDVLIDTLGHTYRQQFSAARFNAIVQRCAPLQMMLFGHPVTMGLPAFDLFMGDKHTFPEDSEQSFFIEKIVKNDSIFAPYYPSLPLSKIQPTSSSRLRLISSHKIGKLSPSVLRLWNRILCEIPETDLYFKRHQLCTESIHLLSQYFNPEHIQQQRIIFSSKIPKEHMQIYNTVDVLLDTQPFCGHITACEALLMGIPVVSQYGCSHAGRMVASLLYAVKRPEWIANNDSEFIDIIAQLANQANTHQDRENLRADFLASPICDGASFTRSLEKIIETSLANLLSRDP